MRNPSGNAIAAAKQMMLTVLLPPLVIAFAIAASRAQEPAPSKRHVIEMRAFEFQPAVLRVNAGDTIIWINRDIVPHTATAGKQWDTGKVESNASGSWVVQGKGEHSYVCTYHPGMRGKLVVR